MDLKLDVIWGQVVSKKVDINEKNAQLHLVSIENYTNWIDPSPDESRDDLVQSNVA